MNNEYEVYKFSINTLEDVLNSVERSFKNYQNTNNTNIDDIKYIEEIRNNINKIKNNMQLSNDIEDNNIITLEEATDKLRNIITESCNKLTSILESSKTLLNTNNENITDKDILTFNSLTKLLNTSFWESRYHVSKLGIKYPSNLYEKLLKNIKISI